MRILLLVAFLTAACILAAPAAENPVAVKITMIAPKEAKDHVDEKVTVIGKCVEVSEHNGNIFMSFDEKYPQQPFYAFIPSQKVGQVDAALTLQSFEGKTCSVSGKVELHKGRPQIVVLVAKQIQRRVQGFFVGGQTGTDRLTTLEQKLEADHASGASIFIDGLSIEKMRETVPTDENLKSNFTTSYYEINRVGNDISVRPREDRLRSRCLDETLPPLSFDHVQLEQVVAKVGDLVHTKLRIDASRGKSQPVTLKTEACTVREFLKSLAEVISSRKVILSYAISASGERLPLATYVFF